MCLEGKEHSGERHTAEGLPLAGGARVAGELAVGLETDLAGEGGLDLTLVGAGSGEERTAELGLDEELGVEDGRGRVEGRARDRRVDEVGGSDGVSGEEPDDLEVLEADIEHTCQDFINGV